MEGKERRRGINWLIIGGSSNKSSRAAIFTRMGFERSQTKKEKRRKSEPQWGL